MKIFNSHIFLSLVFMGNLLGQNHAFKVGERLEYAAQFNIIPAGTAWLEVVEMDSIDDNPVYHVRFSARSGIIADQIYIIRDRVDIWMDTRKMATQRIIKKIREGGYRQKTRTDVHYQDSIAVTGSDTLRITQVIRDPYSLFYYLRTIPLNPGQLLDFSTFDNQSITRFQLKVDNRETILVPAGTFPCIVVKPFRKGRTLFKNQGDMKLWFSDDKRRLPVQIQIKLKYGSMLLRLKKRSPGKGKW